MSDIADDQNAHRSVGSYLDLCQARMANRFIGPEPRIGAERFHHKIADDIAVTDQHVSFRFGRCAKEGREGLVELLDASWNSSTLAGIERHACKNRRSAFTKKVTAFLGNSGQGLVDLRNGKMLAADTATSSCRTLSSAG
jgi:hypothetical protein